MRGLFFGDGGFDDVFLCIKCYGIKLGGLWVLRRGIATNG